MRQHSYPSEYHTAECQQERCVYLPYPRPQSLQIGTWLRGTLQAQKVVDCDSTLLPSGHGPFARG